MKINDALAIAASQFIQQFTDTLKTTEVLERYAVEELQIDSDSAKKFSMESVEGKANEWPNTEEDKTHFFTWYFINYVSMEQILKSKNNS